MNPLATRIALGAVVAASVLALGAGLFELGAHARLFALRLTFPLDLEWMESGILVQAQRLTRGQSIYPPPSVDFIPFLYTPLYPALLALLAPVVGLGYIVARTLSLLSLTGALVLVVALAAGQAPAGRPRVRWAAAAVGLACAGTIAASFGFAGGFFDLARADSLLLLLETGAMAVAFRGRSRGSAAAAGLLIVAAFMCKQTAAVVGFGLGVTLLIVDWRRGLTYGLVAALLLGASVGLVTWLTDGWFWTYIFRLHQSHDFRSHAAWIETPLRLLEHAPTVFAALVLSPVTLAAMRRLERRDLILGGAAVSGFLAACLGFGTQWAFENAFIPGIAFPALAAAVFTARLVAAALDAASTVRPRIAAAFIALLLAAHAPRVGLPSTDWIPKTADRIAAGRLLAMLRALPGEVFIPFHPWYAVLAGKRPYVHRMGVMDVTRAGLPRPSELDEAIASRRFAHIVLDWKSQPGEWPGLEAHYRVVRRLRGGDDTVRTFSGANTAPELVLAPIHPASPGAAPSRSREARGRDGSLPAP